MIDKIKIWSILVFLVIILLTFTFSVIADEDTDTLKDCVDTDNGQDKHVPGVGLSLWHSELENQGNGLGWGRMSYDGSSLSRSDFCIGQTKLVEHYCGKITERDSEKTGIIYDKDSGVIQIVMECDLEETCQENLLIPNLESSLNEHLKSLENWLRTNYFNDSELSEKEKEDFIKEILEDRRADSKIYYGAACVGENQGISYKGTPTPEFSTLGILGIIIISLFSLIFIKKREK